MPSEHGANFDRKVREIIAAILKHEKTSIRSAMTMLEQLRRDLIAEMTQYGKTEFELKIYRQIERAAAATLDQFRRDLEARVQADLKTGIRLGVRLAEEPLVTFATTPLAGITPQLAIVAAEYSLAYVNGLSISAKDSILGIIRRAALGGVPIGTAIKQVGLSLNSQGAFKSIAARAETIVRTEVLRVQAIATQARMLEDRDRMRRIGWELKKKWLTAHDERVRMTHRLVDGQIRDVEAEFDVPITLVGEETEQLLFPRDPKGSKKNTINCRCVSSPVVERMVSAQSGARGQRSEVSGQVFGVGVEWPCEEDGCRVHRGRREEELRISNFELRISKPKKKGDDDGKADKRRRER